MRSHWPRLVALSAGGMVSVLAASVFVSWALRLTPLLQILPGRAPMHHTTAAAFLVSGLALILAGSWGRGAVICSTAGFLLAIVIGLEYATGANLGIDQLLGPEYLAAQTTAPGRMSPVSALGFASFNLSLLAILSRKLRRRSLAAVAAVASALCVLGTVSILVYLLGYTEAYAWGHVTRISIPSAASFVLLGVGLAASAWQEMPGAENRRLWLPLSAGLGLATAVLGIWQALMQRRESDLPLLSGIILVGGLLVAALLALTVHLAQEARSRSSALRQSEEGFRRMFEESPVGLALLGRDNRIEKSNAALCRMVGYSEAELTGRSFRDITHPNDPWVDETLADRLFNGEIPYYQAEKRYLKKNGDIVWADMTALVIHDGRGRPLYGLAMIVDITERRRTEAELRLRSEIIAHMEEGVSLIRPDDGIIVHANPKFERMFGYEHGELVGKHVSLLNARVDVGPEEVARRIGVEVVRTGAWQGEILHLRKDGTPFLCAVTVSTFRHPEFGFVGVSIHQDITERKRAEQKLAEQAALLNLAHDAIIVRDLNYKITFWNRGAADTYGWSAEETQGRDIRDIIPTKFPTPCQTIEALLQTTQAGWEGELQHQTRDGRTLVMDSRWSLLRDGEGKPWAILQINRDITGRKSTEEQMRSLSERLSLATRVASIGVWDWDLRSGMGTWDETMYEIYGIAYTAPVTYERWRQLVHPDDLARIESLAQNAIQAGTQYSCEFRIIRPNGVLRHVASTAGVVQDAESNVIRVVGTAVDITERKRMEAEIEAGKEQMVASARLSALGMMAGGIAHEINNPLSIIHALASDLVEMAEEQGAAPVGMVLRNSTRIRETADRIARIVKSLRLISREGSRDTFHPVSVSRILDETLEICRERFRAHSIKLVVPTVNPELTVTCREVQLAQVLLNLLQNAFDAVAGQPGQHWVRVDVTPGEDSIAISVTDSGPGVAPELRSRIMEPFFTTKAVGKGTGLGLSLSKTIAEEHGGKLRYGEEQGHTCFSLELPLARRPEAVWS